MEVHIAPDLQEKLALSAAKQSRDVDELVQEAVARYLADEARFFETGEGWTDEERLAAMSHIEEGFYKLSAAS
jgi:hypothetical protein